MNNYKKSDFRGQTKNFSFSPQRGSAAHFSTVRVPIKIDGYLILKSIKLYFL